MHVFLKQLSWFDHAPLATNNSIQSEIKTKTIEYLQVFLIPQNQNKRQRWIFERYPRFI